MEKKNDDYNLDDDYNLCDENSNEFVDITLNIDDNYVDNNKQFELVNLRQRSPSPCKISRSLLHEKFSTDSLNTIQRKQRISIGAYLPNFLTH